jgi:cell division protein FtsW (lipid II flippase)
VSPAALFSLRVPWLAVLAVCVGMLAYLAVAATARWQAGPRVSRRLERVSLVFALVPVLTGLVLVWLAKAQDFSDAEARIEAGELLHLGQIQSARELESFLSPIVTGRELSFVADQAFTALTNRKGGDLPNVGALSQLTVAADLIDGTPDLRQLRARLAEARAGGRQPLRVGLFSAAQIRVLKPLMVVRTPGEFYRDFMMWAVLAVLSLLFVHVVWSVTRFSGDPLLLPPIVILCGLGLILMTSLRDPLRDTELFASFAQGVTVGAVGMLIASSIEYQRFSVLTFFPLAAGLLLSLLLLLFGSGPGVSDAKVNLGPVQPVEAIRLCLIFFFAGYFAKRWQFLRELRERRPQLAALTKHVTVPKLDHVLPVIGCVGVTLLFFYLQRDLGPALLLASLFLALYGIARGRFVLASIAVAAIIAGVTVGAGLEFPRTVAGRVRMFLSPWDNDARGGDQLASSLWALSTGGLFGSGPGLGQPADVPASHTDLILAAVGEEMGLVGVVVVVACWVTLLWRGRNIADSAGTSYTYFLACGCILATAFQVVLIAGGVFGLMPLSGVVSPFLSFGRSAMVANFALVGILASVSANKEGARNASLPFRRGLHTVGAVIAVLLVIVLGKVIYVQAWKADEFVAAGVLVRQQDGVRRFQYNPRLLAVVGSLGRGTITDRNGIPLASSRWDEVLAHRKEYERAGISLSNRSQTAGRYYPLNGLTFHVLGNVLTRENWAATNTSYAEREFEAKLRGFDMIEQQQDRRDARQSVPGFRDYRPLVPLLRHRHDPSSPLARRILDRDRALRLTIDAPLTVRVTDILKRQLRAAGKDRGAVIVIDVESGGILASVSVPHPGDAPYESIPDAEGPYFDRARFGLYPPGSVFKLVTAAAALRQDQESASRIHTCQRLSDGRVGATVRGMTIRDDVTDTHPHGAIDMQTAIGESCNAYFADLAVNVVGADRLFETAKLLRLAVASPNSPSRLNVLLPQAAYGQGEVVVTPMQVATLVATIANDGRIPNVHIVESRSEAAVGAGQLLLPAAAARLLAAGMRKAVVSGTARVAGSATVSVAGKTGTAEVDGGVSHAWFAGFAPYEGTPSRRIAFAVLVEHGQYGGTVAARIGAELVSVSKALGLLQ